MTDWNVIKDEYKTTDLTMKDLAKKHGVKASTLRSRKNREGWTKADDASQRNDDTTQGNSVATQKAIEELNESSDLNERQKQFCLYYLKYFNATKAYQEAYDVGYNTASTNGSKLLANTKIKAELDRLKEAQRSDLYLDSLDIKRQWMKQAFADITDFVEFGQEEYITQDAQGNPVVKIGSYVRLKDDVDVDGTLVQEVRQGRDGVTLKLHDKQKALEKLQESLETSGSNRREVIVIKDDWAEEDDDDTED